MTMYWWKKTEMHTAEIIKLQILTLCEENNSSVCLSKQSNPFKIPTRIAWISITTQSESAGALTSRPGIMSGITFQFQH